MTKNLDLQVHSNRSTRSRIGLVVDGTNAMDAVKTIAAAEAAGVEQIWMGLLWALVFLIDRAHF